MAAWIRATPAMPRAARPQSWGEAIAGMALIYRDPAFWRLAPLSSMVIGTAFALHGLGRAVDGRR